MNIIERNIEEIEDHGEYVLTRTIKEVWHKKSDLEAEAEELAEQQEEEMISERTGISFERLADADACSVCGGEFSD
tara:strand:- start:1038 stop:1265 length:228 start_codon:yes stop_codon:yes gene_type:complete